MSRLKLIEGYDLYFVSDDGKIYSDKYKERRELSPRKNKRGYLYVNLCRNGKYKSVTVHKLVAKAFLPDYNTNLEVNHIDGNKENNNVLNLECVTRSMNIKHAFINGLNIARSHEEHHAAKLTEKEVKDIRDRYNKGEKMTDISKSYPIVSYSQIKNICRNRNWN